MTDSTPLVELGKRIRALRLANQLSQEALAFNSGIDFSYLGRIERGENNPTYLVLSAISKALNTTLKDLI